MAGTTLRRASSRTAAPRASDVDEQAPSRTPLDPDPPGTWPCDPAARTSSGHPTRRVLVVEDEYRIRQMLAELLQAAGYGVLEATDGLEALQIVRDHRPDLIVLDLTLPHLNGWQFLEQSREDLNRENIPVLIVSAVADQGRPRSALGVAAWLTKPLDVDRFLRAVETLAGPSRAVPPLIQRERARTRILVVEDEAPIREILVDYLRDEGYTVDQASTIARAEQCIAVALPDLLLLDLMLPGRSGWDFLRDRRHDPALANIRVLALSAAPRNLLLEAKELGADAFLSKPFDLDVLSAMVQSFVS